MCIRDSRKPFDTLAFLFYLRMHIKAEGQVDRSMPQQGTDCLAVRAVLNTERSKRMPQAVEPKHRQIVAFQKAFIKSAVGFRLQALPVARKHIGFRIAAMQFAQQRHKKMCIRDSSHTFAALDPSSSECLRNVAALLKTTHASPKPFSNTFDWTAELRKYEHLIQGLDGQLFSDYPYLKEHLFHFIERDVYKRQRHWWAGTRGR